jgi:hypothetical protein
MRKVKHGAKATSNEGMVRGLCMSLYRVWRTEFPAQGWELHRFLGRVFSMGSVHIPDLFSSMKHEQSSRLSSDSSNTLTDKVITGHALGGTPGSAASATAHFVCKAQQRQPQDAFRAERRPVNQEMLTNQCRPV